MSSYCRKRQKAYKVILAASGIWAKLLKIKEPLMGVPSTTSTLRTKAREKKFTADSNNDLSTPFYTY
jgi:hypothetical protein